MPDAEAAGTFAGRRHRLFAPLLLFRPELGTSSWLLQLRWFAVVGQLLTIGVVDHYFGEQLPIRKLLGLVGFTAATNVAYWIWLRGSTGGQRAVSKETGDFYPAEAEASPRSDARFEDRLERGFERGFANGASSRVATGLMIIDLFTLTGMLHFSGGADNPFAFFYFVNLAVGGVILQPRWAWTLAGLAIVGFAWLLVSYTPIDVLQVSAPGIGETTRRFGAFVAFSACALVVTYFVTRTAEELTRRERELHAAQEEQARSQQLEGLSTLAAGAAHELATPMSTIAVIARELGRQLEAIDVPPSVRDDLKLVNSQLHHCRMILSRMRSAAGDYTAERWDRMTVGELIDSVLEGIREPHRVEISDSIDAAEDVPLWLPREAVAQAIRNLVHNGLDASPEETVVTLDADVLGDVVRLRIRDSGGGMSEKVLNRIGEPFFTTKEPGRGMGLGLFLTRNVIKRLGGTLVFDSLPGRGTEATVTLPRGTDMQSKKIDEVEE